MPNMAKLITTMYEKAAIVRVTSLSNSNCVMTIEHHYRSQIPSFLLASRALVREFVLSLWRLRGLGFENENELNARRTFMHSSLFRLATSRPHENPRRKCLLGAKHNFSYAKKMRERRSREKSTFVRELSTWDGP